jgi:hypothetical protein
MISISTHISWRDPEHNSAVVQVGTTKCIYQVAIRGDEVTVVGPGVEEKYFIDSGNWPIPSNLTLEGTAVIAVIMFEEEDD